MNASQVAASDDVPQIGTRCRYRPLWDITLNSTLPPFLLLEAAGVFRYPWERLVPQLEILQSLETTQGS